MSNLDIYEKLRTPPQEALRTIKGGRISGFTDINPMWRLKAMTEQFGAVGIGWYYTIEKQWTEPAGTGTIAAFTNINLYIKVDGEWSKPIPGTGGSEFISKERNGLYMSDECYKMALTDALSVAFKSLGMGADVYWESDPTKYTDPRPPKENNAPKPVKIQKIICPNCNEEVKPLKLKDGTTKTAQEVIDGMGMCADCWAKRE